MAVMNPNLILQAGQTADIIGSMGRGNALAAQTNELQRQNALARTYEEFGPGLVSGDETAINRLAALDPTAALNMRTTLGNSIRADRQVSLQEQQVAQNAAHQDRTWQLDLDKHFADLNEAELAQQKEAFRAGYQAVSAARSPQEWDESAIRNGVPQLVGRFDQRDEILRSIMPIADYVEQYASSPKPEFRPATPEEAARYGAQAGQFGADGRFYPINPPSGMSIETGPDGTTRIVQGPGAGSTRPLTETQSKDAVYATRAEGALAALEAAGPEALTDRASIVADQTPLGIGRGIQSDEYQIARNAANEFLQAILRKDTGAAITRDEMSEYGVTYLPQPGDGQAVLQQKTQARRRALEALKAGMSADAMLQQERALQASGSGRMDGLGGSDQSGSGSQQTTSGSGGLSVGHTEGGYRYIGGDPSSPSAWEPVR